MDQVQFMTKDTVAGSLDFEDRDITVTLDSQSNATVEETVNGTTMELTSGKWNGCGIEDAAGDLGEELYREIDLMLFDLEEALEETLND